MGATTRERYVIRFWKGWAGWAGVVNQADQKRREALMGGLGSGGRGHGSGVQRE